MVSEAATNRGEEPRRAPERGPARSAAPRLSMTSRLPAVEERSAGGIIVDVHGGEARIAVIARRNRAGRIEWCLPKGHIEGTTC